MRILAIDFGERRTGLAVSDELGITAQGLDTVEVKDEALLPEIIAKIALEKNVGEIVIGLPLNMDGTESEKSKKVREFGAVLSEKTSLPVFYRDERMTSMQAHRVMNEMNKKTFGNKKLIDRISATLILQDYLKTK
jgi:putative holliday junction resolvase